MIDLDAWSKQAFSFAEASEDKSAAAAPEKGKAIAVVMRLSAAHFGVKPAQIRIVAGQGSPRKLVEIQGAW